MKTRSRNKDAHPGLVVNDVKQKHQTAKEMEEIHAQEVHAQKEQQKKINKNIWVAAAIEDKLQQEDIEHHRPNCHVDTLPVFCPPPEDDDMSSLIEQESDQGKLFSWNMVWMIY